MCCITIIKYQLIVYHSYLILIFGLVCGLQMNIVRSVIRYFAIINILHVNLCAKKYEYTTAKYTQIFNKKKMSTIARTSNKNMVSHKKKVVFTPKTYACFCKIRFNNV